MPPQVPHLPLLRNISILHRRFHTSPIFSANKAIVLEKPEKFNPPSHPTRLGARRRHPGVYGGPLTEEERKEQNTKQYPHMFPPKGTFMHWFLTSKGIHLWITLGTLTCLAVFVNLETFHRESPVAHLLPNRSYFWSHPLDYLSQYLTIYKMHVNAKSAKVQAARDRRIEDIAKMKKYREEHGIEDSEWVFGFGRRLYKKEKREGEGEDEAKKKEPGIEARIAEQRAARGEEYVDIHGRKRPVVKKWLGIWS